MKIKAIPLAVGVVGVLVAVYLIWPEWFGFCQTYNRGDGVLVCSSPYSFDVGFPLLPLAVSLVATSLIAFVVTKATFRRWMKFTLWYVVIGGAAYMFFLFVGVPIGFGGLFIEMPARAISYFFGALYALITIPLFVTSEFKERRNK